MMHTLLQAHHRGIISCPCRGFAMLPDYSGWSFGLQIMYQVNQVPVLWLGISSGVASVICVGVRTLCEDADPVQCWPQWSCTSSLVCCMLLSFSHEAVPLVVVPALC